MRLNSRLNLISRLRRGRSARKQLVESHIAKGIAYQIRATRDRLGWSQERLAQEVGMNQNAISRLESPDYGKTTLTTLKRIASALDVALVVRFVPFSEFIDWVSGTPRIILGLNTEALAVPTFDAEERAGVFQPTLAALAASGRRNQKTENGGVIRKVAAIGAAGAVGATGSQHTLRQTPDPHSEVLNLSIGGIPGPPQEISAWR